MKTLFQKAVAMEINTRLASLQPSQQRQWGKMDVAQMMAHCSAALEVATGQKNPPRIFIGRILGPLFKKKFLSEAPFDKNYPTDKSFIMNTPRNFEQEKTRLAGLIQQFASGGADNCTRNPHSFFGKLTPEQWALAQYKHLDHHFRQFRG